MVSNDHQVPISAVEEEEASSSRGSRCRSAITPERSLAAVACLLVRVSVAVVCIDCHIFLITGG